jgi:hypothetical protein
MNIKKYEVYKMNIGEDDELIKSNLTHEEAKQLKEENANYIVIPQYINGA